MSDALRGGHLLADQLVAHGCELAFCVPGESYLPLLDGLYAHRDAVRVVTCRHETAAANAADAYGKLTGRPGICMVTRGPGATQAAVGIHTARQDSTPLILLVGQVATWMRGREAFQEIDCEAVFGSMAKGVYEIDDPARIPEIVASAFSLALSGRQGPVVISLPEDVLSAEVADEPASVPRAVARQPTPDPAAVARLRGLLEEAQRPLVLAGGGPWDEAACAQLAGWATACGLPVAASFRRQDVLDNASASYAGDVGLGVNPALAQRLRDCDLLIAAGPRLTEIETQGYTLPVPPVAPQTLVHVHPDPGELGRVYQPALGIVAGVGPFMAAVDAGARVDGSRWSEWTQAARADYEAWSALPPATDSLDLGAAIGVLRDELPRRHDLLQRRRQLHGVGAPLHPLSPVGHPTGPPERRDGLWPPRRAGRPDRPPQPPGGGLCGRRLLSDGRSGAGHNGRRAAADPGDRRQQPNARDDPHAPGAPLPGARHGHGSRQPGLHRAGSLLRSLRGPRAAPPGAARGGAAGPRRGRPRAHRAADRSRRPDPQRLALRSRRRAMIPADGRPFDEVLAVRYGTLVARKSALYYRYADYGEPDAEARMDYFFWVLRRGEETVLVDTGFGPAAGARRGRTLLHRTDDALRRLGIDPASVAQVIITHLHYDHTGNLDLFPGAHLFVDGRELAFWSGPYAGRHCFAAATEPRELAWIAGAQAAGRVTAVGPEQVIAGGVRAVRVGGHSPGQQILVVPTVDGEVVIASDAAHFYEELALDRPFDVLADLQAAYAALELLRRHQAQGRPVAVGHDPEVMRRFPAAGPGLEDLAVRITR